jgi:NAD(P)-dependent dehydrogenase (short-subunit alcohol dehydrogenase family)
MKTALITGADGGIGTALCRSFRDAGYRVMATDRDERLSLEGDYVAADLIRFSEDETYRHTVTRALRAAVGQDHLKVIIHNAAVQVLGGCNTLSLDDWQRTLHTNLLAPFFLSQAFLSDLESNHGSIIHIASIHARLTKPGFVAYATSKAALEGLTRAMAVDLGPRIRVNAISPAATSTPMLEAGFKGHPTAQAELQAAHPLGRIATPQEIAQAALFLASDAASFMSGSVLSVDGAIGARLHDPV